MKTNIKTTNLHNNPPTMTMLTLAQDIFYSIAMFLDYRDLLRLALSSSHFGAPRLHNSNETNLITAATAAGIGTPRDSWWSLAEAAARQNVVLTLTAVECDELRVDVNWDNATSWLVIAHRLQIIRDPLTFRAFLGCNASYLHNDYSHVTTALTNADGCDVLFCRQIMSHGKHSAVFTMRGDPLGYLEVGILPAKVLLWAPEFPVPGTFSGFGSCYLEWCQQQTGTEFIGFAHSCFYSAYTGYDCAFGYNATEWHEMTEDSWHGQACCEEIGDEIELHLDLERGQMSVYKNGLRLGIMRKRLEGDYVWAVRMSIMIVGYGPSMTPPFSGPPSVFIKRGQVPCLGSSSDDSNGSSEEHTEHVIE